MYARALREAALNLWCLVCIFGTAFLLMFLG